MVESELKWNICKLRDQLITSKSPSNRHKFFNPKGTPMINLKYIDRDERLQLRDSNIIKVLTQNNIGSSLTISLWQ